MVLSGGSPFDCTPRLRESSPRAETVDASFDDPRYSSPVAVVLDLRLRAPLVPRGPPRRYRTRRARPRKRDDHLRGALALVDVPELLGSSGYAECRARGTVPSTRLSTTPADRSGEIPPATSLREFTTRRRPQSPSSVVSGRSAGRGDRGDAGIGEPGSHHITIIPLDLASRAAGSHRSRAPLCAPVL